MGALKYFTATVEFPSEGVSFDKLAEKLSTLMGDFTFAKEESGRFDEVPAFVASGNGANFVLFGIPDGEQGDCYVLEFSCSTDVGFSDFCAFASGFIKGFVSEKQINDRGYYDYSEELANRLRELGVYECKAVK